MKIQQIPANVWAQLEEEERIYVWHNAKEILDVAVDGFGNVMISAPCLFRIGAPREGG